MANEANAKLKMDMKQRLRVDELEENIDELEDVVEDVFPVLILTVIFSFILLVIFIARIYLRWSVDNPSKNRLEGKTVLITGASSGIGKSTAVELAKRGARVLISGRDKAKIDAVARNIRKKTGNQQVNALILDLASLRSIKDFADEFNSQEKCLHVLINNASYMGPKAATDDGLERSFGVNYLGHFYLTHLLEEKIKKSAPSKIINVISDSYSHASLDLDDLALNKGYSVIKAYARSKFCQAIFNLECHRQYFPSCVWNFAVDPGSANTDLYRNYPGMVGNLWRIISRVMFKSSEAACQTVVYCAVADGLRDFSGKIFSNCKALKTSEKIKDKVLSAKLWNASAQLCGFESNLPLEEESANGIEKPADEEEKKSQ